MATLPVINPSGARSLISPFLANKRYVPVIYTDGTTQRVGYVEWSAGTALILDSSSVVQPLIAPQRAYIATATTTLSNSATETSVVPTGLGSLTIPSGVFDVPGYSFRFEACGTYTNTLTGLVTLKVKVGAGISLQITSLALPNLTAKQWYARGLGTVRASRVLSSLAVFSTESAVGLFDDTAFAASDITIAAGSQLTDFSAKWAVAATGSSITVAQLYLELIPPAA